MSNYNTIKLGFFHFRSLEYSVFKRWVQILAFVWKWNAMVPLYSLSTEHVSFNLWKWHFDRFCLIDFSILSVNFSYVCIIYFKIYEKMSSGGLEVSLSIWKKTAKSPASLWFTCYFPILPLKRNSTMFCIIVVIFWSITKYLCTKTKQMRITLFAVAYK